MGGCASDPKSGATGTGAGGRGEAVLRHDSRPGGGSPGSGETSARGRIGLGIFVATLALGGSAAARDNFLVVVVDDVGVDKVGAYNDDVAYGHPGEGGHPAPTPTIDGLAADGVLFRNAYTNPSCAPTRAAALTGRHGFRTGIGTPVGAALSLAETLLPEVIGGSHRNAAIGKWHIGPNNDLNHPNDSGFTDYAGALGGGLPSYTNWSKVTNGSRQTGYTTYATTDNVDEAISFIASSGANPWFLWLAFNAPHTPFHAPTPATLHSQTLSGDPNATPIPHYAAALEAVDTELARLLASIPSDVLDDTTIVFLGDNGTPNQVVEPPFVAGRAKGSLYEGGINVPFVVKSPHVPVAQRGGESVAFVQAVDVFATLADIAGVTSPTAIDSLSFLPLLHHPSAAGGRDFVYVESFSPNGFGPYTSEERAALDGRYKLIWRDGLYEEMFDLDLDPFEGNNLLAAPLAPTQQAAFDALSAEIDRLHTTPVPGGLGLGWWLAAAAVVFAGRRVLRSDGRRGWRSAAVRPGGGSQPA